MENSRVAFCFLFPVFLSLLFLPASIAQLSPADRRILFQLQEQLEFPEVLKGWNNWTSFCWQPTNPSLVIVCSGNHITELTVIGNKSYSPASGNSFSISQQTLSDKFSIDTFFTILTKLSSLRVLSLVSLGLWGPLPAKINRLWSLEVLNLSSNSIYGGIPLSISTFKNLTRLVLSNNLFNGSVPDLKGLQTLEELDLGNNHLGPEYPSLGYNLVSITLKNNSLRIGIPPDLMSFDHLERFDISANKLVGPIPSSLFSLPSIQFLNLAQNQFSGAISTNISCNAKLVFVDISNNLLIGKLPTCIGSNSTNRTVISSWNCLSNGSSNYQHPYSFCQKEALAVKPPDINQGQKSTVKLGVVLGIIGGIVGLAGVIGLLVFAIFRRAEARKAKEDERDSFAFDENSVRGSQIINSGRRRQSMRTAALGLPPYHIFTLEEMEDATNNFDTSNLVGEGSQGQLYKGRLGDGSIVMVKCLKLKQKHSPQLLQQHMKVISKLRHRHLVGLESPLNGQEASKNPRSAGYAEKDDIFHFGTILLQVITGKPINSKGEIDELRNQLEISLAGAPARLKEATDPSIRGTFAYESLTTAVQIVINCLSEDSSKRPSIEDVLWHMQYSVQVQEGWNSSGNLSTKL